jgi:aminoglycoside phosphotransferase (APT) family kinase protein
VLDWELSTLGHPFADLAYQCMQWRLPNEGTFRGLGGLDRAALGIPDEAAYVARYCERMGLAAIPHWPFQLAFSFFRLAAILQGVKRRALDGNASNPEHGLKMGEAVPALAAMAMAVAEGEIHDP